MRGNTGQVAWSCGGRHLRSTGWPPDNQIDLPSFFDDQVKIREIIWGADEVIVYNAQLVMRFLEHNDAAPASGARVTDTMYEYCLWLGETNRNYNRPAHIELTDVDDHIGYDRPDGMSASLANALACLAIQKWIERQRREEQ